MAAAARRVEDCRRVAAPCAHSQRAARGRLRAEHRGRAARRGGRGRGGWALPVRLQPAAEAALAPAGRARAALFCARLPHAHDAPPRVQRELAEPLRGRSGHAVQPSRRSVARTLLDGHGARYQALDALRRRRPSLAVARLGAQHARSSNAAARRARRARRQNRRRAASRARAPRAALRGRSGSRRGAVCSRARGLARPRIRHTSAMPRCRSR